MIRVVVQFKSVEEVMWLPAVPRSEESVTMREVDCDDLTVDKVVWSGSAVLVKVRDRLRGHKFMIDGDVNHETWMCKKCGLYIMSSVPPSHPEFFKDRGLCDCDEMVTASVMKS